MPADSAMLPDVVPGPSNQSSTFLPLTNSRLGCSADSNTWVPSSAGSIHPVVTAASTRLFPAAELDPAAHASAAIAHASDHAVVQQSPCEPSPHTAPAHPLQPASSAAPATCSEWAQPGTWTMPFRISVGGAAGPSAVAASIAYTNTLPC